MLSFFLLHRETEVERSQITLLGTHSKCQTLPCSFHSWRPAAVSSIAWFLSIIKDCILFSENSSQLTNGLPLHGSLVWLSKWRMLIKMVEAHHSGGSFSEMPVRERSSPRPCLCSEAFSSPASFTQGKETHSQYEGQTWCHLPATPPHGTGFPSFPYLSAQELLGLFYHHLC